MTNQPGESFEFQETMASFEPVQSADADDRGTEAVQVTQADLEKEIESLRASNQGWFILGEKRGYSDRATLAAQENSVEISNKVAEIRASLANQPSFLGRVMKMFHVA